MTTRRCVALVSVVLAACSANDDVPAPQLAAVTPDHAPIGAFVTVTGSHFCSQPEDEDADPLACDTIGAVSFGAASSSALAYADTSITTMVPDHGTGAVDVTVVVAGRVSNRLPFRIE